MMKSLEVKKEQTTARKKPSRAFQRAVQEVLKLPGVILTYKHYSTAGFQTRSFYIRVIDNEDVEIHLGERKTFDRWANSINFATKRSKGRRHYYPLFKPQYNWALKVLHSGLFDFGRYIGPIQLPWFETGRNN